MSDSGTRSTRAAGPESSASDHARPTQAHARRSLRWPVRVSAIDPEIDPGTGLPCYATIEESSVNVSEGGVFVPAAETLTPGRRVVVELELPSEETVQALGRVVWRRSPMASRAGERSSGMGIQFTGMPGAAASALADALQPKRRRRSKGSERPDHFAHR